MDCPDLDEMSEGSMIRCRPSSPNSPALLLDDDDLLRLPTQPSSLPRASLVCKRWRSLVSDPVFLRRFRAHHRKPPLLGLFSGEFGIPVFNPALDPPDRIPPARFSMPQRHDESWMLLDSRHGLALLHNRKRLEAVVWDPITVGQRCVPFPPELEFNYNEGNDAVLCAAGGDGHVHGGCHLSPFKLVLVRTNADSTRAFAPLYESGSGVWGNFNRGHVFDLDEAQHPDWECTLLVAY